MSALSICIVLCAFVVVISVSLGSRVSLSIFGFMFIGSVMFSICSSKLCAVFLLGVV